MKNLLLNAVEELVVKANKEIDDARNDILRSRYLHRSIRYQV